LPRLSSRGESIRKTSGLQSNLFLFAVTNKAICQKNHPCSWKGGLPTKNPVLLISTEAFQLDSSPDLSGEE
jgi:hypothetical protein